MYFTSLNIALQVDGFVRLVGVHSDTRRRNVGHVEAVQAVALLSFFNHDDCTRPDHAHLHPFQSALRLRVCA